MKRPWLWAALILAAPAFPAAADSQIGSAETQFMIELNPRTGEQRRVPVRRLPPGAPLVSPGLPGSDDPLPLRYESVTPLPPGMVFAPNEFEVIAP